MLQILVFSQGLERRYARGRLKNLCVYRFFEGASSCAVQNLVFSLVFACAELESLILIPNKLVLDCSKITDIWIRASVKGIENGAF